MTDSISPFKKQGMYIYYKMAERLYNDCVETLNSVSYSMQSCVDFRNRYNDLRSLLAELVESKKHNADVALPKIKVPYLITEEDKRGLLSSVIMATGQVMAMIEGTMNSFDKEIKRVKKENKMLKQKIQKKDSDIKKLRPAIPAEIITKIPSKLTKNVNSLNFNYANGQWDATAMMCRKVISDSIDLKFRMLQKIDRLIDNSTKDEYSLPKKINICSDENIIRRNTSKKLNNLKLIQDAVTHSYKIQANPDDVEKMVTLCRLFLEELYS